MRRAVTAISRNFLSREDLPPFPSKPNSFPLTNVAPAICLSNSLLKFFSSDTNSFDQNPRLSPESSLAQLEVEATSLNVEDVNNKELKSRIEKYFKGDEEALPSILEAILHRKLTGKHEDTDDELVEEFRFAPLDDVKDKEFESDFEEAHETDEEINDLYNARDIVTKRMLKDEYFNMDDKKWDDIVREAMDKGYAGHMRECEEILEDMLHWDKLLPDDVKQKVSAKLDELGNQIENQELETEAAYEQYKEFEDQMVKDCIQKMKERNLLTLMNWLNLTRERGMTILLMWGLSSDGKHGGNYAWW